MNSPVCEAGSNNGFIGPMPVLHSVVFFVMPNDTKERDQRKGSPSLGGKRATENKSTHNKPLPALLYPRDSSHKYLLMLI